MSENQRVLITGSSSGFGFLIAETLLKEGHTVYASMRAPESSNREAAERLERTAKEATGDLHVTALDVTDESSVDRAVRGMIQACGGIDVAVNNAGWGVGGFLETVTDDQFRRQLDVNLFGVQRVMRAVLPTMRRQGKGLVINISSIMGRIIIPFAGAYTASKWALEGLSESYRYELAGTGVEVVIVEPGGFGTQFMANMESGADIDRTADYPDLTPTLSKQVWGGLREHLHTTDGPDPREVADAVNLLIQTPAGRHPVRVVVDPMSGGDAPRAVNRTSRQVQETLFEEMGLKALLPPKE